MPRKGISQRKARKTGDEIGADWTRIELEQFRRGMEVELEHGRRDSATDVTGDDLLLTGKIALAHLNEFPDYYTRLAKMEEEAKAFWSGAAAPVPEKTPHPNPLPQGERGPEACGGIPSPCPGGLRCSLRCVAMRINGSDG